MPTTHLLQSATPRESLGIPSAVWERAPEWAQYIVHEDGRWWWFEHEPHWSRMFGSWEAPEHSRFNEAVGVRIIPALIGPRKAHKRPEEDHL